jgi:SAM-dependent methyltransferase
MNNYSDYFAYLKQKSIIGDIYRKYFLYPAINKRLNGIVLDIGSGLGNFLKFRSNSVGVDVNPYFVEYCVKSNLNVTLMRDNKLPFGPGEFNSVLLDNVLEHIEDPSLLIMEIYRVLDSSGCLLVGVPGLKGFNSDGDHKVYYDFSNLISTISKFGFSYSSHFYMPFFRSKLLSKFMRQYCLFVKFSKSNRTYK